MSQNKWLFVKSGGIFEIETIKSVEIVFASKAYNTPSYYFIRINFKDNKAFFQFPQEYELLSANNVIQYIHEIMSNRETTLQNINKMEKDIDELRQMIIHLPQVGSVYVEAKNDFDAMKNEESKVAQPEVIPEVIPEVKPKVEGK